MILRCGRARNSLTEKRQKFSREGSVMLFEKDDALFLGTAPFGRDVGEIVRELVEANGLFGIGEIEFDGLPENRSDQRQESISVCRRNSPRRIRAASYGRVLLTWR